MGVGVGVGLKECIRLGSRRGLVFEREGKNKEREEDEHSLYLCEKGSQEKERGPLCVSVSVSSRTFVPCSKLLASTSIDFLLLRLPTSYQYHVVKEISSHLSALFSVPSKTLATE